MARLSESVRAHLRLFAFFLANGTVDYELMGDDIDYGSVLDEPSDLPQEF